ncbi:fibronectin type III domain-containing protein [Fibrella aquatica]|uniref:fibronectin type III domain-containing protein n=1 Tax=Fibrella aquatica TaxID=3242487 RepID=UPI003520DA9D
MPTLHASFYQLRQWVLTGLGTLLLLLGYVPAQAQEFYPVVARFTQLPPYPVYLADFSNPSQTNLSIQVQQNDRSIATRPFRIRIYIEGQGFQIQSTDLVQGEPPLTLSFGQVYNLPAEQVANYFKQYNLKVSAAQYARPFSEGAFRFGVEIIDFATNRPISGIQWANPVWISINEPPVWVMPQNALTMKPTLPQNIVFQWSPRHTNVSDVEYEFTITDLLVNGGFTGNVQNLFLAQPAYYKTRTRATTLVYDPTMPPLVPGRTYAYRVEAIAKRGREDVGVFRNNGFSEIQYFNYGTPLLPPSNLRLAWNDGNPNEANLNWKGEANHQSFVVEVREKGQNGPWRSTTINPQATGLYNSFAFNGLDPGKAYEARVSATGGDGQRATSVVVPLAVSTVPTKQVDFSVKGKLAWAFSASEEDFTQPGSLLTAASQPRTRQLSRQPVAEAQPGSRRFPLEGAIVSFYSTGETEVDAATFARQRAQYPLVATVSTNARGEYECKGSTIKLLGNARNLHVVARFKNNAFGEATTKLSLPETPTGDIVANPMTLIANTFRYAPTLVVQPNIPLPFVEEVALYRLKSVVEANPYLREEGNAVDRREVRYNNDTYLKVTTFSPSAVQPRLFTNNLYNDQLVMGVKERGGDTQFFPITGVEAVEAGQVLTVADQFRYAAAQRRIRGVVARGTAQNPVADVTVYVLNQPYKTDKNGVYEAVIPASVPVREPFYVAAIDPLDHTVSAGANPIYEGYSLSQNLLLTLREVKVTGSVVNDNRKPIEAAVVTLGSVSTKTSADGSFTLNLSESALKNLKEKKGTVSIRADDYVTVKMPLDSFALKTGDPERYERLNIKLDGAIKQFRVIVYKGEDKRNRLGMRNLSDSLSGITYFDVPITVNGQEVQSNKEPGHRGKTSKTELTIAFANAPGAKELYTEKTVTVKLPEKPHNRDTVYTFRVRLKPAQYIAGVVLDSTLHVEGLHTDADSLIKPAEATLSRLRPIGGVKVENEGVGEAETNANGFFRVLVESETENTLKFSRPVQTSYRTIEKNGKPAKDTLVLAYNDAQVSVSTKDIEAFSSPDSTAFRNATAGTPDRLTFKRGFMLRREKQVPTFTKLLGFDAKIEKAVRNSGAGGNTFKISGQLLMHDWLKSNKEGSKLFEVVKDKELILNFKDIVVKPDLKDKTNAVPVLSQVNLVDTEFDALLFGFAPVKVEGNPAGEPFIRLQHIAGKPGQGKIGGSTFQLTQNQLFGFDFGKMELTKKAADKKAAFGKFNTTDAVDVEDAKNKSKDKKAPKEKKKDEDKPKAPDKELYLLAFATQNLEEMKVDDEYEIEFIAGDSKRQSRNATTKADATSTKATTAEAAASTAKTASNAAVADMGNTKSSLTRTVKQAGLMSALNTAAKAEATASTARSQADAAARDASKVENDSNYVKFPLGNTPVVGKSSVGTLSGLYVNIERTSAVLKKSGMSMKGALTLPQIPFMDADIYKLEIDKIDVGKDFLLKQATFVRNEKKNIHELSVGGNASYAFLMEWKSVQILNNFKGYGIGGRISTDKDNYVDINSLALTVVDGRFYPSMELALPEKGFRVKNIKFVASGKKSLALKPNLKDKSYELEASLKVEYDDSPFKTARTDSTNQYGRLLSEAERKVAREEKAAADKKAEEAAKAAADKVAQTSQPTSTTTAASTTADAQSGGLMKKVFPFDLQKFVWSTTGKWLVSAKPRPIELGEGFVKINVRRLVFTRAGKNANGSPDAVKKSELNDLLAMSEGEVSKANETGKFNNANTQIKKDSLGNDALDKDGKRVRTGVFDKNEQEARGNTSADKLTVKELADKILKEDANASVAFGFAGGIELASSDAKGLTFDSDVSLLIGDFGKGWELSMNEIMLKLEAPAFKLYGKVKVATDPKKYGFEGAVDLETVSKRFAANFKYYSLPNNQLELGAGIQVSTTVPMGPITWISMGGGFDLNTQDNKYKVFFVGSATPTLTVAEPKLCTYKDIRVLVEFNGNTCGALPVIKGSAEQWINGDKQCVVQVELDFCRTRLMAKLNCEIEVSKDAKAEVNALVIADKSLGIFVGANVRVDALGGIANGLFGLPILFKTTASVADGMPIELAGYMSKIPAYLIGYDNTTATGLFLKMDLAREFRWSDRVSVLGLNLVEANVEAVLRSGVDMGVNFRSGNFQILGRAMFEAEGKVSVMSFALNGKLGLGLLLDGGYRNDIGWNFMAQARGELQIWRDNSAHIQCNDYKVEREWYEDEECADRNWYGTCNRYHKVWKQYGWLRLDKLTTRVKVCVNGSFGGAYQARGENNGWRLLK